MKRMKKFLWKSWRWKNTAPMLLSTKSHFNSRTWLAHLIQQRLRILCEKCIRLDSKIIKTARKSRYQHAASTMHSGFSQWRMPPEFLIKSPTEVSLVVAPQLVKLVCRFIWLYCCKNNKCNQQSNTELHCNSYHENRLLVNVTILPRDLNLFIWWPINCKIAILTQEKYVLVVVGKLRWTTFYYFSPDW